MSKLFEHIISSYLPQARWWPWKNTRINVEVVNEVNYGNILLLLFRSGDIFFHLPLAKVSDLPGGLESRGFCLDNECYVEAEYLSSYIDLISMIQGVSIEYHRSNRLPKIIKAKPLTLESTNSVTLYEAENGGKLVLKSYRVIPVVNIEAQMLRKLAEEKYTHIPEIIAFLKYKDMTTGVLSRYVEGVGDGGYPFYNALLEYLGGKVHGSRLGLASKLGIIISGLHKALNKDSEGFFSVEPASSSDIKQWCSRIEKMYSGSLKRMDEINTGELDYWRGMLEKARDIVEDAISLLEVYNGLLKARIHQDLHLGQMIYVKNRVEDFIIVDFEGEPGRSIEERLSKEPVTRDVASMIRSFHYLSHAAIMHYSGRSQDEVSRLMIEDDPSTKWRLNHVKAMVYSYSMDIDSSKLLGVPRDKMVSEIGRLLYPWIIERAVYEVYYESLYRPNWVSIPIAGLYEASRIYRGWII